MTKERFHEISHLSRIREVADEIGNEEVTDEDIRELMDEIKTDKRIGENLGLEENERIEYSELFLKDLVNELSNRKNEAIVRVGDSSHELLGKVKWGERTILGPEVGIEFNREIMKKRVGLTYGK